MKNLKIIFIVLLFICLIGINSTNASKFNMSYLYGNYNYTNLVNRTNHGLNEVSPSYFDLNDDGTLHLNAVDKSFVADMHEAGVKVVPFLSNHWDREKGRSALANIDILTNQIVEAIQKYNLDGINIDIENVTGVDRDNYTKLVSVLRNKLPNDKSVSVAVAANPNAWTSGWHASYDYEALGQCADYLMIMTYDEHYEGGPAGPVASIEFVEESIKYALKYVPKDKIVMGIPFFGRYWRDGASYGGYGVSLNKIASLVSNYKSTIIYDKDSESVKATITITESDTKPSINGRTLYAGTYTFWYENEQSIKAKLNLVHTYDIKGTGSWSLGQECASTWDYYNKALSGDTTGLRFLDVTDERWSASYIDAVKKSGYMEGKSEYTFAPVDNITRAEFATTIARALKLNIQETSNTSYLDTNNHWARNYIEAVREAGIMTGYGDGYFMPNASITREEVAKVLSALGIDNIRVTDNVYFLDVNPKSWSYGYILDVVRKGFMQGYPGNTFSPGNTITREEIATVIARAFQLVK